MTLTPRTFVDFAHALRLSYEEEVSGEAYFMALAEQAQSPYQAGFWRRLAALEAVTAAALKPAVAELGLLPADPEGLRAQGRADAPIMSARGWDGALRYMIEEYPAYLAEFAELCDLAPPQFAALGQILIDHEQAMIDVARAERAGDPAAQAHLDLFIAKLTKLETNP